MRTEDDGNKQAHTLLVGGFNPSENISQNGNLPQIGVNIKNVWNHHLVIHWNHQEWTLDRSRYRVFAVSICRCFLGRDQQTKSSATKNGGKKKHNVKNNTDNDTVVPWKTALALWMSVCQNVMYLCCQKGIPNQREGVLYNKTPSIKGW